MLPSETPNDLAAEEREYALAKAYTEEHAPRMVRPGRARLLVWLLLVLAPMAYAAIMPAISDDLLDGWFRTWTNATAGLTNILSTLLPGLSDGSAAIYASSPEAMADFMNFASIDVLCVFATCVLIFALSSSLRWVPKVGSPQLAYLAYMAKGFPVGRGRKAKRVGGTTGGLAVALLHVLLVVLALFAFYIVPVLDGDFFRDAHYYCAESTGFGRHSHCIRHAAYALDPTLWKLGWMSSLATAAVPLGIWLSLVGMQYPVWLALGRPTRP